MQEAKAEAAVEALAQMTAPQTSVLRDGKVMRINTADVVPGDIIVLAEGDSVSADGRLVNAASLRIAEASLTGESVPVGKKPDTLTEAKALGDRANMIFNGTSVTQGTGRAIVTGTGMNTQVARSPTCSPPPKMRKLRCRRRWITSPRSSHCGVRHRCRGAGGARRAGRLQRRP